MKTLNGDPNSPPHVRRKVTSPSAALLLMPSPGRFSQNNRNISLKIICGSTLSLQLTHKDAPPLHLLPHSTRCFHPKVGRACVARRSLCRLDEDGSRPRYRLGRSPILFMYLVRSNTDQLCSGMSDNDLEIVRWNRTMLAGETDLVTATQSFALAGGKHRLLESSP